MFASKMDLGTPPRRFTVLWPKQGGIAFFAELAHFLFELPDAGLLHPEAEIDPRTVAPARLDLLRKNLDALAARGFWRRANEEDGSDEVLTPDFESPPRVLDVTGHHGQWVSVADPREDPQIRSLSAMLDLPPSIAAVVADDPLDPRLLALDREHSASGRPYLLVRLAGDHPAVGPLFNAGENTACWACLSFRLLWNQPVRGWYHRTHPGGLSPIPVVFRPEEIERQLPRFAAAARRIVDDRIGDMMIELPRGGKEPMEHPVIRRPQCAVCGDPRLYTARAEGPVNLSPAKRIWDEDGGFRTRSPEQTALLLERVLSPFSGLVLGVSARSGPKRQEGRIFRAWFGKTTYRAGFPRTDQLFQTTLGKGISAAQSRVSAISESIERLAANYHGDEPVFKARAAELPGRSYPPSALAPFSEAQLRDFAAEGPAKAPMHAMLRADPGDPLLWTPVWSLTRAERCFVPFTWCYSNTPYDEDFRCRYFHNGGAAGNCLEEAILQGFLEIVERDSVAVWWYNRLSRPGVICGALPEELEQQLAATLGADKDYWVLDVTGDFGIPVLIGVSQERQTGKICLGFGCHLDPSLALRRALTELCQILEIRDNHSAPFDFDAIVPEDYLFPDKSQPRVPLNTYAAPSTSDIAEDVRTCVARAEKLGLETLVLDYSRPDLPLRTAKVIVPGTCHLFPYRGARRLYDVPVRMEWRNAPLEEAELNPLELLI